MCERKTSYLAAELGPPTMVGSEGRLSLVSRCSAAVRWSMRWGAGEKWGSEGWEGYEEVMGRSVREGAQDRGAEGSKQDGRAL